jgi:hypothetical protein
MLNAAKQGNSLVEPGDFSAFGSVDVSMALFVVGRQNNNSLNEHGKAKRASIFL